MGDRYRLVIHHVNRRPLVKRRTIVVRAVRGSRSRVAFVVALESRPGLTRPSDWQTPFRQKRPKRSSKRKSHSRILPTAGHSSRGSVAPADNRYWKASSPCCAGRIAKAATLWKWRHSLEG